MEEAWSRSETRKLCFDVSSYEYSIVALCYALRVNDAENRISQMKTALESSDDLNESLIICSVVLARAFALLGNPEESQRKAQAALDTIEMKPSSCSASSVLPTNSNDGKGKRQSAVGGM